MRVKFGNATKDVSILEVTAENYIVPVGEEREFHCKIEQRQFNPKTGQRQSKPRIQKFEAKSWPMHARNLRQQGWEIEVLYDPTDFLKAEEEKQAKTREQIAKEKAEAEAKKMSAECEAIKAELLAELKAAGVIPAEGKKDGSKGGKKEQKDGGSKK